MACSTACLVRPWLERECRVERVRLEMIMRHVMRFRWGRAAVTDRLSGCLGITRPGITGPGTSALMPELRPRRENLSCRENLNFFPGEAGNDFLIEGGQLRSRRLSAKAHQKRAERQGFEPWVPLRAHWFSRPIQHRRNRNRNNPLGNRLRASYTRAYTATLNCGA